MRIYARNSQMPTRSNSLPKEPLYRAQHALERRNVTPSTFTLFHVWADLRGNYETN